MFLQKRQKAISKTQWGNFYKNVFIYLLKLSVSENNRIWDR